jgi:hypothetical protein
MNVLFVCLHNSARSQMAAAFLERARTVEAVESAGTHASERIHPLVIEAMREVGIEGNSRASRRDRIARQCARSRLVKRYARRVKRWLVFMCVIACKRPAPVEHDTVQSVDAAPVASASVSVTASASASAVANEPPPAPVAYVAPDGGATWETMMRFAKARVAKANAHELELVRMPIHMHGVGWGCTCPAFYVGTEEMASETMTVFLDPTFESAAAPVAATETRIAEGYFTGKTSPFHGDADTMYTLYGFRVLRTRIATADELEPEGVHAKVIAAGGLERPTPEDKRIFLLIEASFPLGPGADEAAKKRADKFRAQYPSIEVVDSRTVPGLFCCNDVVVLDRFATQAEASTEEKRAKSVGAKATIRRGW